MSTADRDAFGHWLSGFTDGEACFFLGVRIQRNYAFGICSFQLHLRSDDRPILEDIKAFWGAGTIISAAPQLKTSPKSNWQTCYRVNRLSAMLHILIPHFEKYPLRSKKQQDFMIWKEAVYMHYHISLKKTRTKWTKTEFKHFQSLRDMLRAQRKFEAPSESVIPPKASCRESQQTMW
jgi:hypothetical protein